MESFTFGGPLSTVPDPPAPPRRVICTGQAALDLAGVPIADTDRAALIEWVKSALLHHLNAALAQCIARGKTGRDVITALSMSDAIDPICAAIGAQLRGA